MEQISLFSDEISSKKHNSVILSASRMTDMPKYYPDDIINEVCKRLDKGVDIHTLVLWTKHPGALLHGKLADFIEKLKGMGIQVYLQCTITGMGGKYIGQAANGQLFKIEPNSPDPDDALKALKDVIKLLESPERIRLRIDPLIRIVNMASGQIYSNLKYAEPIISASSAFGITNFNISFLENGIHKKVDKRFETLGWEILSPSAEERIKASKWVSDLAFKYNVNIYSCCVPGLPESRCIDGYLLQELHPCGKPTRKDEQRKRKLCGCTHSIDIGGWPPKKCFTGCQYCYANSSY